MGSRATKSKEISFVENGGDITVKVNGVVIEVHTDGSVLARTNGSVMVCPINDASGNRRSNNDGQSTLSDAAQRCSTTEPNIGDKMKDGTIFAGISPNTGKAMYATPADASLTMEFNKAREYVTALDAHGHQDWRVPTKAELGVLFNNRAAIGGFDLTGSNPSGSYWSSQQSLLWHAWSQRFSDGLRLRSDNIVHSSVRPVR